MVDWTDWYMYYDGDVSFTWGDFVDWFLSAPLFGQILIIVGIVTIIALVGILVYYIMKGIAYLIYYIFKGIGYLFYYLGLGIYKICEGLYYTITGKQKKQPVNQHVQMSKQTTHSRFQTQNIIPMQKFPTSRPVRDHNSRQSKVSYELEGGTFCPMCGEHFSEKSQEVLRVKGKMYCSYCGSAYSKKVAHKIEG